MGEAIRSGWIERTGAEVRLGEHGRILAVVSLPGLSDRLVHHLEPGAPPPRDRLTAVREFRRDGIDVGVRIAPILPGLTDRQGQIERTVRAAAENGAMWLEADVLRLSPDIRATFLRRLRVLRPDLVPRYRRRFGPDGAPPKLWAERVLSMVAAARTSAGLPEHPPEPGPGSQMRFPFLGVAAG
jgi:DNA repair photolyase